GQSITQSMLAGPQLVHDGQSVSLVAQGQGVRLVALGKAMENGRQGQTILARNVQSGRVVSGVVDASGQILVAMQP
ncbi:MAG: flagella basal body P-ring formation protein FlgA, partial [Thiomonas sp. 14-66-4]